MRIEKLDNMIKGWFVGDFSPSVYQTKDAEVAVKVYKAGDSEEKHVHKVATEITVIVSGEVIMNGKRHSAGDIIILDPGEATDFLAVSDTTNVVVKVPSVPSDKYPAE